MFRALIGWMDRDWAGRKYSPIFAFGQRFLWCVPVFLTIPIIGGVEAFGFSSDSWPSLAVTTLGILGSLAIMLTSLYRWTIGYSRSNFQERAAAEHRGRAAARREALRRLFKRNVR